MKKKKDITGIIYLIHFDEPLHHAKHYIGYTENLPQRLQRHRAGHGARILEVLKERGITWKLARIWTGDKSLERKIKRQKCSPKLCPICKAQAKRKAGYNN